MNLGPARAPGSFFVVLFQGLALSLLLAAARPGPALGQAPDQDVNQAQAVVPASGQEKSDIQAAPASAQDQAANRPEAAAPESGRRLAHLLARVSYAPLPGQAEALAREGGEAYLESQLEPASLPESPELETLLAAFPALALDPVQLFTAYGPKRAANGRDVSPQELQKTRAAGESIALDAARARMWRAILSTRQLQEIMTAFWAEQMPIVPSKGPVALWTGHYENLLRAHALGSFPELLDAVCRHPAMLVSADAHRAALPPEAGAKGKPQPVDESFARTVIFQLTMGPKAKPAPADVQALARALMGFSFGASPAVDEGDGFFFDKSRQAQGPVVLFGKEVEGEGVERGRAALRACALHPATAAAVCRRLAAAFLEQEPSKPLFEAMLRTYAESDGHVGRILRVLLTSDEFHAAREWRAKLRNHARYAAFIARASGLAPASVDPLLDWLASVGVMSDQAADWGRAGVTELGSGGLMPRLKLAADLGGAPEKVFAPGQDGKDGKAWERAMAALSRAESVQAAQALPESQRLTFLLGAPEAQRY